MLALLIPQSISELNWWNPYILDSPESIPYCRGSILLQFCDLTFPFVSCARVPFYVLDLALLLALQQSEVQMKQRLLVTCSLLQENQPVHCLPADLFACFILDELHVSCWTWYLDLVHLLEGCCQLFHKLTMGDLGIESILNWVVPWHAFASSGLLLGVWVILP